MYYTKNQKLFERSEVTMRITNIVHSTDYDNLKDAVYQGYYESKRIWTLKIVFSALCLLPAIACVFAITDYIEEVFPAVLIGLSLLVIMFVLTWCFFSWYEDRVIHIDSEYSIYFRSKYCHGKSAKELERIKHLNTAVWFYAFLDCRVSHSILSHRILWEILTNDLNCYVTWLHRGTVTDALHIVTERGTYVDEADLVNFDVEEYDGDGSDLVLQLNFVNLVLNQAPMPLEQLNILQEVSDAI